MQTTIEFVDFTPASATELGALPLNGRILVELVRFERVRDRELFLDATVEQPTEYGVVLAVASDAFPVFPFPAPAAAKVEVGDVVMIGKYSGYQIEDERFALVRSEDLVMKMTTGFVKPRKGHRADTGLLVPQAQPLIRV